MDYYRISLGLDSKWKLASCVAFLVCLGTFNRVFSLAAFAVCLYTIAFSSDETAAFLMVFSVFYANIFKVSPASQSLYTYLLLAYVLYQPFKGNNLSYDFCTALVMLLIFLMLQFFLSVDILWTIKFVVGFLLEYYILRSGTGREKTIFSAYIGGVISSTTVVALNILPNLRRYLLEKQSAVNGESVARFAGMYGDPNYFSVNVIIALCLAVILYHRKEMKVSTFVVVCLSLFSFAIMTRSKSALLMMLIPVLMFLYVNGIRGRYAIQVVCLTALLVFVVLALAGRIEFLSAVLARIESAENLNDLTTGRYGLWQRYLKNTFQSFFRLMVGNGLGAELLGGAAPHNTYLDLAYYLGIVGTFLVGRVLFVSARESRRDVAPRNPLNYCVLAVVMIMYFFVSELLYFDMPFHILMAIMVLNMKIEKREFQKGVPIWVR